MSSQQLSLFDFNLDHSATWTPRDLWLKLDRSNVHEFVEDKRLERKSGGKIHFDALAEYISMWANTVDGGIILIGVEDDGKITGCSRVPTEHLNRLDNFYIQMCPEASVESRRIPVTVSGRADFVVSMFVPYKGVVAETHKGEAFTRRGDAKHKMSLEEKDDFCSTRHERSWEQRPSGLFDYNIDFDKGVLKEFCEKLSSA